jgi:hypothetical protein
VGIDISISIRDKIFYFIYKKKYFYQGQKQNSRFRGREKSLSVGE